MPGKWLIQGRPPPLKEMAIFCQKKGLEMPIFGQKQCFLGSGGQFDAPHPILQVLDSKTHVVQD